MRTGGNQRFLGCNDLADLARRGVASPDHVIRTKGNMLVFGKDDLAADAAIEAKVEDYAAATERCSTPRKRVGGNKIMLEPHPCVAWIEGVGIAGSARTRQPHRPPPISPSRPSK
jgi:rhamnose utilization protein RhaD (predicted bifunctional aldolase and dehydrogenase)